MRSSISILKATPERTAELLESLEKIKSCIHSASSKSHSPKILVAVSKHKPSSDILACLEGGQRHFGENYVQELVGKAAEVSYSLLRLVVQVADVVALAAAARNSMAFHWNSAV
jgi:hypothetical protein